MMTLHFERTRSFWVVSYRCCLSSLQISFVISMDGYYIL